MIFRSFSSIPFAFTRLSIFAFLVQDVYALPNLPLSTRGRHIISSTGQPVTYVGVNWPGHMDAMIPEGLQYQSISQIVSRIKSAGFNIIRLTWAVEMVDQILDGGADRDVKTSFVRALGEKEGARVWGEIIHRNSGLGEGVTRLKVFDAVAAECEKQDLMIHLDNHISKAKWCCDTGDGNSWFGDREFDAQKWERAWGFMANHTKSWPALASYGMRNELRSPDRNPSLKSNSYNWPTWYTHMRSCAQTIQKANPHPIVFFSGLGFDTDLAAVTSQKPLSNSPNSTKFLTSDFSPGKIALELHNYQNNVKDCSAITTGMYKNGWNALNSSNPLVLPVVMTEFGFQQNATTSKSVHAQCLKDFFEKEGAGWMYWVLAGSYYIRSGTRDKDETWGLLNHDWSDWRAPDVMKSYFEPMVKGTMKVS